jgi:DNA-binding transcriptional LysR family regulator
VAVDGPLGVDDVQLLIRAAIDGVSLTFLMEAQAAPSLANGQLVRVLQDWCEPFADISSTIRADASNRQRYQPSSIHCGCSESNALFAAREEPV